MKGEYLVTNKHGGYSSSHFMMGNIRKYHSLLVQSKGEFDRWSIVNRVEEYLSVGSELVGLSTNHYLQDMVYPTGYEFIKSFRLDPNPEWHYDLGNGVKLTKSIRFIEDRQELALCYKFESEVEAVFQFIPLFTYRDLHKVINERDKLVEPELIHEQGNTKLDFEGQLLEFDYSGGEIVDQPNTVFENIYYPVEQQRGYECTEYASAPIKLQFIVNKGESLLKLRFLVPPIINIKNSKHTPSVESEIESAKLKRLSKRLEANAKHFVVESNSGIGIVAGYHWFGEWGRDAFIAFKGLLVDRALHGEAKNMLLRWSCKIEKGYLPNQFILSDQDSSDALLWFTVAAYNYYQKTKDDELVHRLLPLLEQAYIDITEGQNGIKISDQGFYYDLVTTKSRTWMDALVNEEPVIDRSGAAVELQGLWYNFLSILLEFKSLAKDSTFKREIIKHKRNLKDNFITLFWNNTQNCLVDVWRYEDIDRSIRPNQVMVLALPFKLIKKREGKQILSLIEKELLTKVGLRTLHPADKNYEGFYASDQPTRDRAYHQGTIWPFLLGFYFDAWLDYYGESKVAIKYVTKALEEFEQELTDQGLIYVPEIFEASTLRPDGCISQAWSVATINSVLKRLERMEKR